MSRMMKYTHFLGLSLFLGSIFTYVVISILIEHASLEALVFGREVVEVGTMWLTVPGLWLLVLSGIYNGYTHYGSGSRFFRIKLGLGALILVNAYLMVVPAVHAATEIARQSLVVGALSSEYAVAYGRETIFGAINVMLSLTAAGFAVWRRPKNAGI